jgi:hypothetical protein
MTSEFDRHPLGRFTQRLYPRHHAANRHARRWRLFFRSGRKPNDDQQDPSGECP